MKEALMQFVSDMPHELGLILLSMIPVAELRLAIPLAIIKYGLNPVEVFFLSVIGNLIPVPFIILFIRQIFNWLKKFKFLHNIVVKIENRGISKIEAVEKYKFWGLCMFVAIPLPGTGAWTGAMIAGLMDMRLKRAMPSIIIGVIIAGIAVTAISLFLPSLLGF